MDGRLVWLEIGNLGAEWPVGCAGISSSITSVWILNFFLRTVESH